MCLRVLMVVVLMLTAGPYGCAVKPKASAERSQGETAPVFRADQVLPNEILRGSNYRIADRVPIEGCRYVFTVTSDFGEFTARGRDMLELRLRELKSIEAARKLSKDPHVVEGILDPLRDTEAGLELLVTEPFESLGRAAEGFELMVNQYLDQADRRAGSPRRRRFAVELDCDPETANPVLKKLLDEMALEYEAGSLLTQAAMSFVPGLSVLSTTAQMKEIIVDSPPSAINRRILEELEAAGVDKSVRSQFCTSSVFTTLQRLQLMEQFRALDGVKNRAVLIEDAGRAQTEAEALSTIRAGKMLADIRATKPIRRLEFVGLPLAVLETGTHVVVCPYDYVTNTCGIADVAGAYRASNPNTTTVLLAAGRISPAARITMEAAQVRTVEEGTPNW